MPLLGGTVPVRMGQHASRSSVASWYQRTLSPSSSTMNTYQPNVSEDGPYPHLDLSGKVIIKAQLGDDIRRIPIHNEDITYDELVLMMQRVFRGKLSTNDDIMVKYKDEDGDLITIFDNSDLSFAIHCSRILKLTLFVNGHPKPLESSEVQYIKQELREIRDKILSLMDRLEPPSAGLTNSSEADKIKAKQHQQMNANKTTNNVPPKEFDPLTINKGSLEENTQTKVMSSFGIQDGGKGDEHRAGTPDSISSLGSSVSQPRPATTPQVPSGQVTPQPVYQPGQSHGHGQIQYPSPQTVQTQQQPQQPQPQQQQIYPGQPQYPSQQPPTPAQAQQIPVAKAGYATPTSQAGQGAYPQAGQSYPGYPPQQQQTTATVGPQQTYPQAQAGFPPASMAQSYPPTSTYSQTTGIQYTQPQSQYQSPYPPQGVPPTAQANPYSRGTTPTGYPRPSTAYPQGYQ